MIRSLGEGSAPAATICSLALAAGLLVSAAGGYWSAPMNLSESEVFTEDASLAADSQGRVHVVWSEGGEIVHRHQLTEGWSAPMTVATGFAPALAADTGGEIHLVFVNRFADVDDVYYTSWRDGPGWQLPVNVSDGVERSSSPSLAVAAAGSRAVVWGSRSGDVDLIYVAESDDGMLWSSGPVPHAFGVRPKVAIGDGSLLVAWHGPYDVPGSAMEIYFSVRSNHQWTLPLDVSASPEVDSVFASLAYEADKGYLAWQENLPGGSAVLMSVGEAGGWSIPQKRSGEGPAYAPVVMVGLGGGHVAWTTEASVQYAGWSVSSGTWQTIEDVAAAQAGVRDVSMALGASACLAWLAEAAISNDDVYYSVRMAETTPSPSATATLTASQTAPPAVTATPTLTSTVAPSQTPTSTATLPSRWLLSLPIIRAS